MPSNQLAAHCPPARAHHHGSAPAADSIHSGVCHGTLGELIQGPYVCGGQAHISLISLPVKKYSCVQFCAGAGPETGLAAKPKCRQAIALYLALHGKRLPPGSWTHDSELLEGKGMASSTADIVATIRCLDAVFGIETPSDAIAALLRKIERSDSVFLDTYALYLSGRQQVVRRFAHAPTFYACYLDEGQRIDTEQAGPALLRHYRQQQDAYSRNLEQALAAFDANDRAGIAACATASAILGQGAVPKQHLASLLREQAQMDADGIFVAHTGSLLGYLYIDKPSPARMGALSSFFRRLGHQCRFVQTGF